LQWASTIAAETVVWNARPVTAVLGSPGIDGAQKAELGETVAANGAIRRIFFPANGAEKVLLHEYPLNV
jgi:hypothetical protein